MERLSGLTDRTAGIQKRTHTPEHEHKWTGKRMVRRRNGEKVVQKGTMRQSYEDPPVRKRQKHGGGRGGGEKEGGERKSEKERKREANSLLTAKRSSSCARVKLLIAGNPHVCSSGGVEEVLAQIICPSEHTQKHKHV